MKKMFRVYDSKAEVYLDPFFCENAAVAKRSMEAAVNQTGHAFALFAADYTLFEVGIDDDQAGETHQLEAKINLGCALEFVRNNDE